MWICLACFLRPGIWSVAVCEDFIVLPSGSLAVVSFDIIKGAIIGGGFFSGCLFAPESVIASMLLLRWLSGVLLFYPFYFEIVYLFYRSFYCVFFSRGDRCNLYPLLFLFGAIVMPSYRSSFGGWWWWAGVWVRLGCWGEWIGLVSPGVLTWIVLALHHPPTVAAAHLSGASAPGISVWKGGWRAPKWSESYSWRIRTTLSRIASTWWSGDWLTS